MSPKALVFLLGLSLVTPVYADIYKYTAPDGRIYYTDNPTHSKYKLIIRSKPRKHNAPATNLASRPKKNTGSITYSPKNKGKYTPIIRAAAEKHQLDPNLLHAVIQAESAYDAAAISSAGAVGLMQLMPATAKRYGVTNRKDPVQNVNGGAQYLKFLLKLFDSNLKLAVAAYNAGENAVKKYKNSIPPYPETQHYVKKVLALYEKYGRGKIGVIDNSRNRLKFTGF